MIDNAMVVKQGGGSDNSLVADVDFEVPVLTSATQTVNITGLSGIPAGRTKAWAAIFTYKEPFPTAPAKAATVRSFCLGTSHYNYNYYMQFIAAVADVVTTSGSYDYGNKYALNLILSYVQATKVQITVPKTSATYDLLSGTWNMKLYSIGGGEWA